MYSCGILTVSDTSFYNKKDDVSGKVIFENILASNKFQPILRKIIPDDIQSIKDSLIKWSDEDKVDLIITTGGTGFTARDVTPEATKSVLEREASSVSQALLIESLRITKFAMLSRGVSGIRKSSLIINLPGSPKAVKECLSYLSPVLCHALDQLSGKNDIVKDCHLRMQNSVRTTVSTNSVDVMNRPRQSTFPLFTVDKAQEMVLTETERLPSINVPLECALNMVTSSELYSKVNVPPFPASIKDGYAVIFSDGAGVREVISMSNAGDDIPCESVSSGKCVRISTGAEVPNGCDSVVQVEDTELTKDSQLMEKEMFVNIKIAPEKVGQDIRPTGNDLRIGDVLVAENVILGPCEIGLLAMGGVSDVACFRRPIVGVLSTGNELVSHNEENKKQKIIDCNRPLLMSFFGDRHCKVVDLGIVVDEPQIILDALVSAMKVCDVIVTTGGVSMGEKDYLKSVLTNDLKAKIHFGRIFMKPGKPTTFSSICNEHSGNQLKLVFSLPGNPVSAFVTSYLFVYPALKKMAGHKDYLPLPTTAKLRHDVTLDIRPDYRRCRLWVNESSDGVHNYEVSCNEFGNQMSSRLMSCVDANALMCLPSSGDMQDTNILTKGSVVSVLKLC